MRTFDYRFGHQAILLATVLVGAAFGFLGCRTNTPVPEGDVQVAVEAPRASAPNAAQEPVSNSAASYSLDRWTDIYDALMKNEDRLYYKSLSRQAETLNPLSTQDLCVRILQIANAYKEEAHWSECIDLLIMAHPSHQPPKDWEGEAYKRMGLIHINLYELKTNLQDVLQRTATPNVLRSLQISVIRAEKELPAIQRSRRMLVEALKSRVLEQPDSLSRNVEDAKLLKTMAIRGSQ